MNFAIKNTPSIINILSDEDIEAFKRRIEHEREASPTSWEFNNVAITQDELAISKATQFYLDDLKKCAAREPHLVKEKSYKLMRLLDMRYDGFGSLSAQQQLTFLGILSQHNVEISVSTLGNFIESIRPYPEFEKEMAEKEKRFLEAVHQRNILSDIKVIWRIGDETSIQNTIRALVDLKARIYDIDPPQVSFKKMSIHAHHKQGLLEFSTKHDREMWMPEKILGLVSHEMDHYIHYLMAQGKAPLPATDNSNNSYFYGQMLYGKTHQIYIPHTVDISLYKKTPTEVLAFATNDISDSYSRGNIAQAFSKLDQTIEKANKDIHARRKLWSPK